MQELLELGDKLSALLKQHARLKAENKRLMRVNKAQADELAGLRRQLEEAGQSLLAAGVARALPTAKEKQKTRKQLDAVIHEIDKILTKLND